MKSDPRLRRYLTGEEPQIFNFTTSHYGKDKVLKDEFDVSRTISDLEEAGLKGSGFDLTSGSLYEKLLDETVSEIDITDSFFGRMLLKHHPEYLSDECIITGYYLDPEAKIGSFYLVFRLKNGDIMTFGLKGKDSEGVAQRVRLLDF